MVVVFFSFIGKEEDKKMFSEYIPYFDPYIIKAFNKLHISQKIVLKEMLEKEGKAQVETVVKYGSPSLEILRLVEDAEVKLVVMGSQGRGYVKEFFLGSVSQNIARLSPSSVLLIPTKH